MLKRPGPGEHRTACPECELVKHRPSDTALAVKIDDRGAVWTCHRCGWTSSLNQRQDAPRPYRAAAPAAPDPAIERKRELAKEIWRQTERIPTSGLPFEYLTRVRGIDSWDDDRLRWHPACPWGAGTAGCIIAPITCHATDYTIAIWRIWPSLTEPMKDRRMGLGQHKGSAARLFPAEDEVVIAEGVEDALAAHALTGRPAWAALSGGNLAALILPIRIRTIAICADADAIGMGHAADLARRLEHEGRAALLLRPRRAKDPNEMLLARNG